MPDEEEKPKHWVSATFSIPVEILGSVSANASIPFESVIASAENGQPLLLQSVVTSSRKTSDGEIIRVAMLPWRAIIKEIVRDPTFLYAIDWRKVEELVAATYEADGFKVTLTPRSGDGGKDVIAVKPDYQIRIFDQVKANNPTNLVTPGDIREMLGTLAANPNTSKGFVTTTADFAPTIAKDPIIQQFVPHHLELRNGKELVEWLKRIESQQT